MTHFKAVINVSSYNEKSHEKRIVLTSILFKNMTNFKAVTNVLSYNEKSHEKWIVLSRVLFK